MVLISRTGLQESEKRPIGKFNYSLNQDESLEAETSLVHSMPPIAIPAPFTHRPLADLPNPFRRTGGACSILCNHPAPPSAVQGLLQAAKGDRLQSGVEDEDDEEEAVVPEELFRRYTETDSRPLTPALSSSASDTQLATRTGPTDSLFCVSSPPSFSAATNSSKRRYGPLSRRSQTPDPPYRPQPPQRQKTMLVLDLRRSQSQDAGIWQSQQSRGGQSVSPASSESPKKSPKSGKSPKITAQTNRKPQPQQQQQQQQQQGTTRTQKYGETEAASKATAATALTTSGKKRAGQKSEKGKGGGEDAGSAGGDGGQGGQVGTTVMPPTPREEDAEERYSPTLERKGARKRPHKKKKKSIGGGGLEAGALVAGRGETPEKEFRGMPEPRETQVSTLAGDGTSSMSLRGPSRATPEDALYAYDARDRKLSTVPHTRPSTSQTRASPAAPYTLESILGRDEYDDWDEERSFLDPSLLRHLERELDRETVEAEFRPVRKRALVEALKSKWQKLHHHSRKKEKMVSMGGVHQTHGLDTRSWCLEPTNLWLNLPRTFSRQSARFELPFDSRKFRVMTPLQYAKENVTLSSGRRMLYNRVFNRHRNKDKQDEEPDEDDDAGYPEERLMSIDRLIGALSDVMGKELTKSQTEYFLRMSGSAEHKSDSGKQSTQATTLTQCLDFRSFSGIAAVCERLIGGCAKLSSSLEAGPEEDDQQPGLLPPRSMDPPHEIETVDFEKLPNHLRSMPDVNPQLAEILMFIKNL